MEYDDGRLRVSDVRAGVQRVKEIGYDDPEVSHGLSNDLYRTVLAAIAEGHEDAAELARAALEG